MSFGLALFAALALQATPAQAPAVLQAPEQIVHAARGFVLTVPAGWSAVPLEDGSGLTLRHGQHDARIEAFAVATEPSGVPGLPDDSVDALALRLDGPGISRISRVRLPLVMIGESGDRLQAGETVALSYSGASEGRTRSGLAATRCGADILLTFDSADEAAAGVQADFGTVRESWALILTGGSDFPC
ncbi:MAG: hypothetical protein ACQRW7_01270 [Caulobacterales bacterium]|uniref:hypothetical protein n=1 Tax=Glycocaulis sp. TaxID=1969725 RepID=UPI003F9EE571